MGKFTTKPSADKPRNPYSDAPLFAHATGTGNASAGPSLLSI